MSAQIESLVVQAKNPTYGSVQARNPGYSERIMEWTMLRDCLRGETAIKLRADEYLPIPSGFQAQWANGGSKMYDAYIARARFPDIVRPTLGGILGIIHRIAADIELPPALEHLRENATLDGLTLEAFHRQITSEILLTGRYGVLADLPEGGGDVYLAGYTAEAIINWASLERDFYVVDETRLRRIGFAWFNLPRFRCLQLVDGVYQQSVYEFGANMPLADSTNKGEQTAGGGNEGASLYETQPQSLSQISEAIPSTMSGKNLDFIPFVIVGSRDIRDKPDESPMIGVARSALSIYRLDADYRHQLFSTGQETLFVTGTPENPVDAIGAGVVYCIPDPLAKAFYVGPTGVGIGAHRTAIADERQVAITEGARLFSDQSGRVGPESGEALRLRFTAESSALIDIANASAAGLEKALRNAAMIVGLDPNSVVVTPNREFIDSRMSPQDVMLLVQAWQAGGIAYETLYDNLQRGEVVTSDRTAQEERDLIESELPALAAQNQELQPQGKTPAGSQRMPEGASGQNQNNPSQ